MLLLKHIYCFCRKQLFFNFPPKINHHFKLNNLQTNSISLISTLSSSVLNLCNKPHLLQQFHARFIILHGHHQNPSLSSRLFEFYAKFGQCSHPLRVSDSSFCPSFDLYNIVLQILAVSGDFEQALLFYHKMVSNFVYPDEISYPCVVRSCRGVIDVNFGRKVHGHLIKLGFDSNESVVEELVEFYDELGEFENARQLFDEMAERRLDRWNSVILSCLQNGNVGKCFVMVNRMMEANVRPDSGCVINLLRASVELKSLKLGLFVHGVIVVSGLYGEVDIATALLTMYSKLGSLEKAVLVFEQILVKDTVVWNVIIEGHVNHSQYSEAIALFAQMKLDSFMIDSTTVMNVLPACVKLRALELVKYIHVCGVKLGLSSASSVSKEILVSYAKCGSIEMAKRLFNEEENVRKDISTWNSMISVYSKHREWKQCFALYELLKQSDCKPDSETFLRLLTACVNSGHVIEGRKVFREMKEIYGYQFGQEHFASMADLFGKTVKPDTRSQGSLLSAGQKSSKTRIAEVAAEKLIALEPTNAGNYVLMSNIYAAAGKWDKVAKLRGLLRERGLKKTAGCSWVEINGKRHEFRVADTSHPSSDDIYSILGFIEVEIQDILKVSVLEPPVSVQEMAHH